MNPASIPHRRRRPGARELLQTAEAAGVLAIAYAAIRILPFKTVVRLIDIGKTPVHRSEAETSALGSEVRRAVKRAARRLPFTIVCFPEGLAAHWMLRRRGAPSKVHYGLRPSQSKLSAHVWVTLANNVIVGEERDDPHICVATFPH